MSKFLIIFEDGNFADFYPMTYLRPVYFLRPGIRSLYERIIDGLPGYKPTMFCRPELSALVSEQTNIPVNQFDAPDIDELILINGRIKSTQAFYDAVIKAGESVILRTDGELAAVKIFKDDIGKAGELLSNGDLAGFVSDIESRVEKMEVELPLYHYLWDLMNDIHEAIKIDFEFFKTKDDATGYLVSPAKMRQDGREFAGAHFIRHEDIYISQSAEILPNVVLDASHGPIFIGTRARIEPNTYVIGPTYVGKESMLVGGKIDACSIGPVCRAGGEVEETIIQGYTNKYHAGFLGHSYLGEWINLGAMTTNSDLKNNYQSVSVSVNGEMINTGSLKIGSFIGDFTKTAIGTLLNTGMNIGICCNIMPGGLVTDKEIPSFTWYSPKHKMVHNLNKALGTIERTMERRGQNLTEALKGRLTEVSRERAD